MKKSNSRKILAYGFIAILLISTVILNIQRCKSDTSGPVKTNPNQNAGPASTVRTAPVPKLPTPDFNADSAYHFVDRQVKFGPRVPNSEAHRKCGAWLVSEFKRFGLTVIEQPFQAPFYKGGTMNGVNIIAQYMPDASKRICIACHWDSRNQAEADTYNQDKPIDGADDGASGIGIMLELARTLSKSQVGIGVDLVCFDLEDNGDNGGAEDTWCLGSQYWSKNLHKPFYTPYYAMLLDMVGAKNPRFPKEGYSVEKAQVTVDRIWSLAKTLGYGDMFVNEIGPKITDDHRFVIQNAQIPMIDIINLPGNTSEDLFPKHHHTHADNMSIIDKTTLQKVGQLLTAFIFQTYNNGS